MANIVKPKLQHVGGNVKIKNYSFNGNTSNTKDVKSMPQLTMVTNPFATNSDSPGFQTNPDKSGSKPINIQLVDVLTPQEGNVESLLSKYHIFDIITEPQEQLIHTIPGNEGVGILNSGDHQSYEEMLKSKPKWEQGIWMKHGKSVYGTGTDENGNYWKDIRGQKHYVDENGNDLTTQPQTNEKQKADEAKKAEEAKKAAEEQRKAEEAKKKEAEEAQRQAEEAKKKEAEEKKKAEEAKKKEQQSNQDNTVGNGKTTEIPDSVRQSGIIPNYTQNYNTRSWGYDQGKLAQAYKAAGSQTDGNIATINDRYLVAVSPRFGKVGDNIDIQLENGKVIHAVIADVKGNDATSSWGHELGGKVDVVEWEINGTSQAELSKTLRDKGWYGSEVTSITNTGSGHYF